MKSTKPKADDKMDIKDEMSEEDKLLKEEIEGLIAILQSSNVSQYQSSLETLKKLIISATTSMTSVPKPLKFLRVHYETLKSLYGNLSDVNTKRQCADIVSVVGIVMTDKEEYAGDSLEYRLLGRHEDVSIWGHEFVRHLTGQVVALWQSKDFNSEAESAEEAQIEAVEEGEGGQRARCLALVHKIIPYFMEHNAETEAIDLCIELEQLPLIGKYATTSNYDRICLYMTKTVLYLADPDNRRVLQAAARIYEQFQDLGQALKCALKLNDGAEAVRLLHKAADNEPLQRQLAFVLARQQQSGGGGTGEQLGDVLSEIVSNSRLSEHFLVLARELDIMEAKLPEDVYKSHLEPGRPGLGSTTTVDSARNNLSASYVNGLVNCGFGKDKLLMGGEDDTGMKWVYKNKEAGMMSTVATLGWILLWDVDDGLSSIDRYLYSDDEYVKAGGLLACGVVNSGVRNECDPALALLGEYVGGSKTILSRAAIVGLGVAYAGSCKPECLAALQPVISETSVDKFELSCLAALSSGMVAVGTLDSELTTVLMETMMERPKEQWQHPFTKFMVLGLALVCLGRQEQVEVILASLEVLPEPIRAMAHLMCDICAYAGSGSVLKIQQLLHILSDKATTPAATKTTGDTDSVSSTKTGAGETYVEEDESEAAAAEECTFNYLPHQGLAVLGVGLISMGEPIGQEMGFRVLGRLLRFGEPAIKRAVPLALALMWASDPQLRVVDTLGKFSHDADQELAFSAVLAMGLVGAGTNNARLAAMLRQLASFHSKEPHCLFAARLAQGLLHLGKGTLTLSPLHQDRFLASPPALAGLLTLALAALDSKKTFLNKHDHLLFYITPAIQPRLLMTLDCNLQPLTVTVRVGQAVDTVGQAGRPKTITGFQTHTTPVLLAAGERAELSTDEYLPVSQLPLEGFVILKKNPNYEAS